MRVLGLCSGIGGIEQGFRAAGFDIRAVCEIDPFCRVILRREFPEASLFSDIHQFVGGRGHYEVITAGFPCQDISAAGGRRGLEGPKSRLWFEVERIIGNCRPLWVLLENSPQLRKRGADRVLEGLEGLGYTCRPVVVGADDVGAPHKRKRAWVIANLDGDRKPTFPIDEEVAVPSPIGEIANLDGKGLEIGEGLRSNVETEPVEAVGRNNWWAPEPPLGRMVHGVSAGLHRTERIRALGNSVVPLIPYLIACAILAWEGA